MGADQFPKHIFDELVKLNSRFDTLTADVHELSQQLHKLDKIITGNGNTADSIIIKVDRLAQESARRNLYVKAAIGCAVTAIFGFIGTLLKSVMK